MQKMENKGDTSQIDKRKVNPIDFLIDFCLFIKFLYDYSEIWDLALSFLEILLCFLEVCETGYHH